MHASFYFKNFILGALAVLLSFLFLGAAFLAVGQQVTTREREETLSNNSMETARLASAYALSGDLSDWGLRMVISSIARSSDTHCFLTDAGGMVVSCSDMDLRCPHIGTTISPFFLTDIGEEGYRYGLGTLGDFYDDSRYISARPIPGAGDIPLGYVFVSASAGSITHMWHSLISAFLLTAAAILLMTLIISFLISRRQARPVNEMAAAARKFARGDFSARVSAGGDDEVGALSDAFNKMAESLEQAERRRSEFLANVAHELKTPMTTISGFADGILDGTIPPESERKYLETISSETKRLNRLVRRMLEMSKMQSAGPEELRKKCFNASELLLQTLLVFEKKVNDKRLEVNAMIPEEDMIALGDADAINQVIYNLLENAVKFATPGSELGVSIFKQEGKAYISVKNHGGTIPPDELALIFDRFHKTDKSRSMDRDGVGLGLYIVKSILISHGEDIVVTSRDGVTEFVFSLTLQAGK